MNTVTSGTIAGIGLTPDTAVLVLSNAYGAQLKVSQFGSPFSVLRADLAAALVPLQGVRNLPRGLATPGVLDNVNPGILIAGSINFDSTDLLRAVSKVLGVKRLSIYLSISPKILPIKLIASLDL